MLVGASGLLGAEAFSVAGAGSIVAGGVVGIGVPLVATRSLLPLGVGGVDPCGSWPLVDNPVPFVETPLLVAIVSVAAGLGLA